MSFPRSLLMSWKSTDSSSRSLSKRPPPTLASQPSNTSSHSLWSLPSPFSPAKHTDALDTDGFPDTTRRKPSDIAEYNSESESSSDSQSDSEDALCYDESDEATAASLGGMVATRSGQLLDCAGLRVLAKDDISVPLSDDCSVPDLVLAATTPTVTPTVRHSALKPMLAAVCVEPASSFAHSRLISADSSGAEMKDSPRIKRSLSSECTRPPPILVQRDFGSRSRAHSQPRLRSYSPRKLKSRTLATAIRTSAHCHSSTGSALTPSGGESTRRDSWAGTLLKKVFLTGSQRSESPVSDTDSSKSTKLWRGGSRVPTLATIPHSGHSTPVRAAVSECKARNTVDYFTEIEDSRSLSLPSFGGAVDVLQLSCQCQVRTSLCEYCSRRQREEHTRRKLEIHKSRSRSLSPSAAKRSSASMDGFASDSELRLTRSRMSDCSSPSQMSGRSSKMSESTTGTVLLSASSSRSQSRHRRPSDLVHIRSYGTLSSYFTSGSTRSKKSLTPTPRTAKTGNTILGLFRKIHLSTSSSVESPVSGGSRSSSSLTTVKLKTPPHLSRSASEKQSDDRISKSGSSVAPQLLASRRLAAAGSGMSKKGGPTLATVLSDALLCHKFDEFLKSVSAQENLYFIQAVNELLLLTSLEEVNAKVADIWATFLAPSAIHRVNISHGGFDAIRSNLFGRRRRRRQLRRKRPKHIKALTMSALFHTSSGPIMCTTATAVAPKKDAGDDDAGASVVHLRVPKSKDCSTMDSTPMSSLGCDQLSDCSLLQSMIPMESSLTSTTSTAAAIGKTKSVGSSVRVVRRVGDEKEEENEEESSETPPLPPETETHKSSSSFLQQTFSARSLPPMSDRPKEVAGSGGTHQRQTTSSGSGTTMRELLLRLRKEQQQISTDSDSTESYTVTDADDDDVAGDCCEDCKAPPPRQRKEEENEGAKSLKFGPRSAALFLKKPLPKFSVISGRTLLMSQTPEVKPLTAHFPSVSSSAVGSRTVDSGVVADPNSIRTFSSLGETKRLKKQLSGACREVSMLINSSLLTRFSESTEYQQYFVDKCRESLPRKKKRRFSLFL